MKKKKKPEESSFCCCGEDFEKIKKQAKEKIQEMKKYAKKNPEKTKSILAGVGVFLAAIFGFLIGKKNKNKDQDIMD